jgi:hypothetical protein
MIVRTFAGLIAGALLAIAGIVPLAHAGEMDEETTITFNKPVQIPGHLLHTGSYVFVRFDNGNGPNVNLIRIFNSDRSQLIATIQTVTTERQNVSGDTVLTFAEESQNGQAPVLVDWFYPGSLEGHEFVYSGSQEQEVQDAPRAIVVANSKGSTPARGVSGD